MRAWIAAGVAATVAMIAIVGWNRFQEPVATASPNEPEASAMATPREPDHLVEVVDVEAELAQPTPLPPQPLPFIRFDEPPYASLIPEPTDQNVVQIEFEEPEPFPSKSEPRIVDGVILGTMDDSY